MSQVLLVDDEKNVLTTLSIGLRRYDYEVRKAQSGPEALKIMEEDPCEIVVSDIRMYPMDGYTLASQIRKKYPGVNIILMSAYGFKDNESPNQKASEYPCLTKPFSITDLISVLRKVEKKEQKKVFVLGDRREGEKIREILEAVGFSADVLESDFAPDKGLDDTRCDLFLIDVDFLGNQLWEILNQIERHMPGKPVVLLTKNKGERDCFTAPDVAVTVLDREMFFNDRVKAIKFLKSI